MLLKQCDDGANDGDIAEIRNTVLGGLWNLTLYENDNVDLTEEFDGQDFSFSNFNQVEVSINDDPIIAGLWRVIRDNDNGLEFILNFGEGGTFGELTDAWSLLSITQDRFELISVSGGDGTTERLVFERAQ